MNLSDEQRDALLIDRLVDGELSNDERRQLLATLEAQPGGWRRCALAFVEAQIWRGAMGNLVRETPIVAEPKVLAGPAVESTGTKAAARKEPSRSPLATWLAVAASVVVAFGVGRQTGVMRSANQAASSQVASSPTAIPNNKTSEPRIEHTAPGDAVTLVVNDRHGVPQRIEVPLVEGRQLGRAFGNVPHWSSAELDRRLDEQGLDLEAHRRYAPIYFEQENKIVPMVVPVDDAIVRPANRPVY